MRIIPLRSRTSEIFKDQILDTMSKGKANTRQGLIRALDVDSTEIIQFDEALQSLEI